MQALQSLHLSSRPDPETPCGFFFFFFNMADAIRRDSKLQMLFYPTSFFFVLVLWILFHPWGVTEQSNLARVMDDLFSLANSKCFAKSTFWALKIFLFPCMDYCPISLHSRFEFSVVLLMAAAFKPFESTQIKQTVPQSAGATPSEANKPPPSTMLVPTISPRYQALPSSSYRSRRSGWRRWTPPAPPLHVM